MTTRAADNLRPTTGATLVQLGISSSTDVLV
jgi:hypothetical protein